MSEPILTLIADDEPLARRQLRALLERDAQIALVGEAGTGQEARRLSAISDPSWCCWTCACHRVMASACWKNSPTRPT